MGKKKLLGMSGVLGLTAALMSTGADAQDRGADYTQTATPPLATEPADAVTPAPEGTSEAVSPTSPGPTMEIEPTSTTMDQVDRDRWAFPNRPLVITGSAVLISAYVPAVVAGAVSNDLSKKTYYPVAGPWMEIAQESNSETWTALLAIDGVFQGLGALALVSGFVIPERKTRDWYLIGSNDVMVTPRLTQRSVGLGAFARF